MGSSRGGAINVPPVSSHSKTRHTLASWQPCFSRHSVSRETNLTSCSHDITTNKYGSNNLHFLFSLFHCACFRVTQLLHQPLHIYKIYKILHIKTLKTLRHVSVLRPSSGTYIFLAKVTLEIVTY